MTLTLLMLVLRFVFVGLYLKDGNQTHCAMMTSFSKALFTRAEGVNCLDKESAQKSIDQRTG